MRSDSLVSVTINIQLGSQTPLTKQIFEEEFTKFKDFLNTHKIAWGTHTTYKESQNVTYSP